MILKAQKNWAISYTNLFLVFYGKLKFNSTEKNKIEMLIINKIVGIDIFKNIGASNTYTLLEFK